MEIDDKKSLSAEPERVDFNETITRLELRAKRSKRKVVIITFLLFFSVVSSLIVVVINVFDLPNKYSPSISSQLRSAIVNPNGGGKSTLEDMLLVRIQSLLMSLTTLEQNWSSEADSAVTKKIQEHATYTQKEIESGIQNLEKVVKAKSIMQQPKDNTSVITSTIGSAVFSLGAVAFVILLIQIAVTFMKYHTRLAELYDAQADALRASNGDSELAYKFIQHFSPNEVEMGKTPTTLYEKALNTVAQVAKNRKGL